MIPRIFKSAADGIAREEALLKAGRPSVILWQAEEAALVVPRSWARRSGIENLSTEATRSGWPLLLRSSGGGAVPQGSGTLNLAMVLPAVPGFTIEEGYRAICGTISEALTRFEVPSDVGAVEGAFCDGAWNVTVGGRKLAGTAQRRSRARGQNAALIHAAILLERPSADFWPLLGMAQEVGNVPVPPKPEAHVALNQALPNTMKVHSFIGALAPAAEGRLAGLTSGIHQAA